MMRPKVKWHTHTHTHTHNARLLPTAPNAQCPLMTPWYYVLLRYLEDGEGQPRGEDDVMRDIEMGKLPEMPKLEMPKLPKLELPKWPFG